MKKAALTAGGFFGIWFVYPYAIASGYGSKAVPQNGHHSMRHSVIQTHFSPSHVIFSMFGLLQHFGCSPGSFRKGSMALRVVTGPSLVAAERSERPSTADPSRPIAL